MSNAKPPVQKTAATATDTEEYSLRLQAAKESHRWLCELIPDLSAQALAGVCRGCSLPYSWEMWLISREHRETTVCANCQTRIYRFLNYGVIAEDLLTQAKALQTSTHRWYHASAQSTWPLDAVTISPELLLHAGSAFAARSRADGLREEDGVATVFLHSFTLSPLTFGAFILEDAVARWQKKLAEPLKMGLCAIAGAQDHWGSRSLSPTGPQAAFYYNRFESPGDLSLLFPAYAVVKASVTTEVLTS